MTAFCHCDCTVRTLIRHLHHFFTTTCVPCVFRSDNGLQCSAPLTRDFFRQVVCDPSPIHTDQSSVKWACRGDYQADKTSRSEVRGGRRPRLGGLRPRPTRGSAILRGPTAVPQRGYCSAVRFAPPSSCITGPSPPSGSTRQTNTMHAPSSSKIPSRKMTTVTTNSSSRRCSVLLSCCSILTLAAGSSFCYCSCCYLQPH